MVLIPAGCLSVVVVTAQTKKNIYFKNISTYIAGTLAGLLLSGFGFLLVQNLVLYGNLLSSGLRLNQNIAEFSLYQIYVHTIRTFAILAEAPLGYSSKYVIPIGSWIIHIIGAADPLPKEIEWEWVGTYKYFLTDWPGYKNFGIAGWFVILSFILFVTTHIKKLSCLFKLSFWQNYGKSEYLPFTIMAFSLFLSTIYILRWIQCGTLSFITPGFVCVLALALSQIEHKRLPRYGINAIFFFFITFAVFFALHQTYLLVPWVGSRGFDWSKISYTQTPTPRLIEKNVPANTTLVLLVDEGFRDYNVFGESYTRKVFQVTGKLDRKSFNDLIKAHPNGFLYIESSRYRDVDFEALTGNEDIFLVDENNYAKLFNFSER